MSAEKIEPSSLIGKWITYRWTLGHARLLTRAWVHGVRSRPGWRTVLELTGVPMKTEYPSRMLFEEMDIVLVEDDERSGPGHGRMSSLQ